MQMAAVSGEDLPEEEEVVAVPDQAAAGFMAVAEGRREVPRVVVVPVAE